MARSDTKYDIKFIDMLPDLFREGQGVAEVSVAMGISRATFYRWCEAYPDFDEAYKDAKDTECRASWMEKGRKIAYGEIKGNAAMWIINVRNRFGWKDVPTTTTEPIGKIEFTVVDGTAKVK